VERETEAKRFVCSHFWEGKKKQNKSKSERERERERAIRESIRSLCRRVDGVRQKQGVSVESRGHQPRHE
jgi:hypothetical protein